MLKSFLEESTIHGFARISSAKSYLVKFSWIVLVVTAFSFAGYLIHKSYKAWVDAPISTTISTHPISSAEFPTISVCPPTDYNEALNEDLANLRGVVYTKEKKTFLLQEASKVFIDSSHKNYAESLVKALNENNLPNIYNGGIIFPRSYGSSGIEIELDQQTGSIHTPFYGHENTGNSFMNQRNVHYELRMPSEVLKLIGETGYLDINLNIDAGKSEEARFLSGSKYDLYHNYSNWKKANKICADNNEVLASIQSTGEALEIHRNFIEITDQWKWIGASDIEKEGDWKWVDNSDFSFNDFGNSIEGLKGIDKDCLQVQYLFVNDEPCENLYPFYCMKRIDPLPGSSNISLRYTRENVSLYSFHVWYTFDKNHAGINDFRIGGVNFNWNLKQDELFFPNQFLETASLSGNIESPSFSLPVYKNYYKYNRQYKFKLDLTGSTNGEMIVQVKSLTRNVSNFDEKVIFRDNEKFKFVNQKMKWEDALEHCRMIGGSLAAIHSKEDRDQIMEVGQESETGYVWIGANDIEDEGKWVFSDGSVVNIDSFKDGYGYKYNTRFNCVKFDIADGKWKDFVCRNKNPFVCSFPAFIMKGNVSEEFRYNLSTAPDYLEVVYKYVNRFDFNVTSWEDKRIGGFNIK